MKPRLWQCENRRSIKVTRQPLNYSWKLGLKQKYWHSLWTKKKIIRAVDKHNTTNHAESSSDMHQSQAHTLPKRPSLVTGARTDKFGLSFWGPNSCMSAYHSVRVEGRGGERESTQSEGTEGQKGKKEKGGSTEGGRISHMRWSNRKNEQGKEENESASYLLPQTVLAEWSFTERSHIMKNSL